MLSSTLAGGFRLAVLTAAALALTLTPTVLPASVVPASTSIPSFNSPGSSASMTAVPSGGTWPIRPSGFLDPEFVHDIVTPNAEYLPLLRMVSPDTLGAIIQHLEDYGTRHTNSQQVLSAGRWLARRLEGFGYTDTLTQKVRKDGKTFIAPRNVIATKTGTTKPDFRVVVGGHYDSITYDQPVPPTQVAPGADDDASGTAGTLEIARILANVDLDATVEFVLFSGHEQGLYGSIEYVTQLVSNGVPPQKLFFINLDMIGNADTREPWDVKIHSNIASWPFADLFAGIVRAYTDLRPRYAGDRRADQTSFYSQGYRAIFVHEGSFSPNYHSMTDLLIHLEMDYEAKVVRSALATVLHLARIAEPPDAVVASETGTGDLFVEWNHSPDADLLGYHVEVLEAAGELVATQFTTENSTTLEPPASGTTYWVRVRAEDPLGKSEPSEPVLVGAGQLAVVGATPNPARDRCRFDIFIPGAGTDVETTLRILDASGRLVRTIQGGPLPRGSNSLHWDATFSDGARVPSGIYFYILEADGIGRDSGKVMVVR